MTPTDTPRTDAMYENHTSEYQRRLLSEDLERKIAAEIANREKCCRDGNAISDELFDTQQKLKKAEAEVAKLNHQLLKTESHLLQSQDIIEGFQNPITK
jgi:septal ring factor EnvC (AmiA/AmiB activator)